MTIEKLQKYCDENNLKVKILFVNKTNFDDYEVVYTFDIDYPGRESYENILEPELDELVKDESEFIFMINVRHKKNIYKTKITKRENNG